MRTVKLIILFCIVAGNASNKNDFRLKRSKIDTSKDSYTIPVEIIVDDVTETKRTKNVTKAGESVLDSSFRSTEGLEISQTTPNAQNTSDADGTKSSETQTSSKPEATTKIVKLISGNTINNIKSSRRIGHAEDSISILAKKSDLKNSSQLEYQGNNATKKSVSDERKSYENLNTDNKVPKSKLSVEDVNKSNIAENLEHIFNNANMFRNSEQINRDFNTKSCIIQLKKEIPLGSTESGDQYPEQYTIKNTKLNMTPESKEQELTDKLDLLEMLSTKITTESQVQENEQDINQEIRTDEKNDNTNDQYNKQGEETKPESDKDVNLPSRRSMAYKYPDLILDTKMNSGEPQSMEAGTGDLKPIPINDDIESFDEKLDDLLIDPKNSVIYAPLHQPISGSVAPVRNLETAVSSHASASNRIYMPPGYEHRDRERLSGYKVKYIDEYDLDNTQNTYPFTPLQKIHRSKGTTTTQRPYPQFQNPKYKPIFDQLAKATQNPTMTDYRTFGENFYHYPENMRFNNYAVSSMYNPYGVLRQRRYADKRSHQLSLYSM